MYQLYYLLCYTILHIFQSTDDVDIYDNNELIRSLQNSPVKSNEFENQQQQPFELICNDEFSEALKLFPGQMDMLLNHPKQLEYEV